MTDSDFDYGDVVRVKSIAPDPYRPGSTASVVGIRETEDDAILQDHWIAAGTRLLMIEFSDGASVEVPDRFLESVDT